RIARIVLMTSKISAGSSMARSCAVGLGRPYVRWPTASTLVLSHRWCARFGEPQHDAQNRAPGARIVEPRSSLTTPADPNQNIQGTDVVVCSPVPGGIEDLGRGDLVKVDCAACHHIALLRPDFLLRLGLSPA